MEDTTVSEIIDCFQAMYSTNVAGSLEYIVNAITEASAPAVLGLLYDLEDNKLIVSEEDEATAQCHLAEINKRLMAQKSTSNLAAFMPLPLQICSNNEVPKIVIEKTKMERLQEIIFLMLKTTSKTKILNCINKECSTAVDLEARKGKNLLNYLKRLLKHGKTHEVGPGIKIITTILDKAHVPQLLEMVRKYTKYAENIFIAFRIHNPETYNEIVETVYSEKRFLKERLVRCLPGLDVNRIIPLIKDYNFKILAALLEKRPECALDVIRGFNENLIGMSKKRFIEAIIKQDTIFCYYASELQNTHAEMLDICIRSTPFLVEYFKIASSDKVLYDIAQIFSKKKEGAILDFVQSNRTHSNFKNFIVLLTKTMRFGGELRRWAVETLAQEKEYFHYFISYLDIIEVERLLGLYYEPITSLEFLLSRFHPQDLLIELQKFRNVQLLAKLYCECVEDTGISDENWHFAMKAFERFKPGVFFYTSALILENNNRASLHAVIKEEASVLDITRFHDWHVYQTSDLLKQLPYETATKIYRLMNIKTKEKLQYKIKSLKTILNPNA
ncbi:hypothetical protein ENBRE01_0785 [Enteropsectra breve]|nr:hypothetical protein ENBRE01_0785 [Enteropsectra breve]